MYYETYRKKSKKKNGRGRRLGLGEWLAQALLKLLALALIAALLCAAILYALPPALFMVEPEGVELALTDGLPGSMVNVLLLGTDELSAGAQRADTVIIASVGYGRLRLTSVLRDTVVDIPGHGQGKLNAAYAYGGAELMMRTINQNFGLNIMHYVRADFVSLAGLVDAIGGVTLDITEAEREQINHNTRKSGRVFAPLGYTPRELTQSGEGVHLDGLQALSYARIRKLDSDYQRTGRQRKLLNAMLAQLRGNLWNPVMWARLSKAVFGSLDTNMSPLQLISLGEKALLTGSAEQLRLPVDGSCLDDGSKLTIQDRNLNRDAFFSFVYET